MSAAAGLLAVCRSTLELGILATLWVLAGFVIGVALMEQRGGRR